jgi:hypothetical protein
VSYTVPSFLLAQYPKFQNLIDCLGKTVKLPEIDDDIGHTVVHYLFQGKYQTLKLQGATASEISETEYRRGVLTYCTARSYEINGLVDHALNAIDRFGKDLTIAQILDAVCKVYAQFPEDEVWLPKYLKAQLESAFDLDRTVFSREEFLRHIGKHEAFTKVLVKTMVNIYAEKSLRQLQEPDQHTAEQLGENLQEEGFEDCPAEEDFEEIHTPPPSPPWPSMGDAEKCPTSPVDEDVLPVSVLEQRDPAETTEFSLPPLSILEGRTVAMDGKVYGDDNIAIGECIEGDARKFARKQYLINGEGNVVTRLGKVFGKCVVLSSGKNQDDPTPSPPEREPIEETDVCPEQIQHMRNGGSWKTCWKCRNLIRQNSIQLLHDGAMMMKEL